MRAAAKHAIGAHVIMGLLVVCRDSKKATEQSLLQRATDYYKNVAVDCTRVQIAIDVFQFSDLVRLAS